MNKIKLNKKNLDKIKYSKISIYENDILIDVITKNKDNTYSVEGIDYTFSVKDVVLWFLKRDVFIHTPLSFCEPK